MTIRAWRSSALGTTGATACALAFTPALAADELFIPEAEPVADGVYAIIGPTDARTYENHGMNANYGIVETDEGVLLIDSGPTAFSAELIEEAVAEVTDTPIRWVLNIGVQDHRWLGNDYFQREHDAEVIAFEETARQQEAFASDHLEGRLKEAVGDRLEGTEPAYADRELEGEESTLELGGVTFELQRTDAHFPGDAMAHLPEADVVFTGDLVYVDRMLGVHPWSSVENGYEAYQELADLGPETVVPGHGQVSDMERVERDTGAYYEFLVHEVGAAAEDLEPLDEVVERHREESAFQHLEHFDGWHTTNINRAYLEFEW
ncbi:MBL fold metallo-hydrolase [Halorhodospira halophila]|uniref:Beta-lactamase domain protein n=1 Tax=Halorhodospira halophila (strain DSM 244 / SL1) TaxID=349124 RepID=A1WYE2_HALHL|nr:MBL fold metallo-hydrolase [Halorhodospira halophila]ABM62704.1 beta-lactamase domain protein [Halorhodospira halophila SL1]